MRLFIRFLYDLRDAKVSLSVKLGSTSVDIILNIDVSTLSNYWIVSTVALSLGCDGLLFNLRVEYSLSAYLFVLCMMAGDLTLVQPGWNWCTAIAEEVS